jgi:hypothetical protein
MKALDLSVVRMSELEDASLPAPLGTLLAEALEDGDGGLPPHLWERALLGPAREFLRRPGKQFRARLVEACWMLAGGAPGNMPAELPLIVELLHAGSLIVDDIEDGSHVRRGAPTLHEIYGTALALNTGNWMYFWPLALIDRLGPRAASGSAERTARGDVRQRVPLFHRDEPAGASGSQGCREPARRMVGLHAAAGRGAGFPGPVLPRAVRSDARGSLIGGGGVGAGPLNPFARPPYLFR